METISPLVYKRVWAFFVVMLIFGGQLFAQPSEITKKINKTYKVGPDVKLSINNRYGKVHVNSWDKKEITVDIVVKVSKRGENRAQELLESVEVDIEGSAATKLISFKTRMSGNFHIRGDEGFSINYTINMPGRNPLSVKNHYGELYVADRSGKSRINVAYGNFRIGNLTGESDIELAYGSGELESMKSGYLELGYSKLYVEKLGDIEIDSRYSKIKAVELGNIKLEDRYGSLKAKRAISVDGEIKYAGFELDYLANSLDLSVKYGKGVEIEEVSKDFKRINIDASYTTLTIDFQRGASFSFDGSFGYCSLKYDEEDFDFKYINKGTKYKEFRGEFGSKLGSRVNIESNYGSVYMGWSR